MANLDLFAFGLATFRASGSIPQGLAPKDFAMFGCNKFFEFHLYGGFAGTVSRAAVSGAAVSRATVSARGAWHDCESSGWI